MFFSLFCMFFNFYPLDVQTKNGVALTHLDEALVKDWIENRTSYGLDMVFRSVCLLIL